MGFVMPVIYLPCSDENNTIGQDIFVTAFVLTVVLGAHPRSKKKIRIKRLFFTI